MAGAGLEGAAAALPRSRSATRSQDLETAAWLSLVACAAVTVALVVLLGPPLSRVLYPATLPVLPSVGQHPEPVEGTRYLLALLGPVLLVLAIALVSPRLRIGRRGAVVPTASVQLAGLALVVACLVRQQEAGWELGFFNGWQFVAGAMAAVALALAARRGWLTGRRPETRVLRILLPAVALVVTGIWFLSYLNTADTICWYGDCYNTAFLADETFAVLNGLTPLVDHTAAYGSLWPFVFAPLMAVLGKTLLVWTILMWALSVAMLLAIYGVLRRVTHSSLAALALYLPIMALTFFGATRSLDHPQAIYQQVPLRTAGPFLLAWLVARRIDRGGGAVWPLGLAAGLVALNNVDFGLAALGATAAALLWTEVPRSRRGLGRFAASFLAGIAIAYALVAVVTLIRAGALPNPARAIVVARVYSTGGIGVSPLPHVVGLPLAIYLTYVGAIGVATARALRGAADRTLTGMLVWSGLFGLGSAVYYMGPSGPAGVPTLFPPWGLSLALLAVAAVRSIASGRTRLPSIPALASLFGIGLIATLVLLPPTRLAPWSEIARLRTPLAAYQPPDGERLAPPRDPAFKRFVSSVPDGRSGYVLRDGAPVALFTATGHQLADAYGLKDVVPYTGESVFTEEQVDEALDRLHAAGGSTVLVLVTIVSRVSKLLGRRGFEPVTSGQSIVTHGELTKWVKARALDTDS